MKDCVRRLLEEKPKALETVTPHTTVRQGIERMNARKIGSLLVMNGDRLVGIFTERDVLTRVVPRRLDCEHTPIGEVMTREVVTIHPQRTVEEAMMVMTDTRHRHLPVMEGDRVVGLISIGDLTRWTVRDQQRTIEDLIDYVQRA
jgi:CBS domain-containing protein